VSDSISTDYDKAPWIKMPVAELTTPTPGRLCMGPRYWAVTPDNCVLFYKAHYSPQCNVNEEIVHRVRPGLEVRHIPMAFVPHRCSDFS